MSFGASAANDKETRHSECDVIALRTSEYGNPTEQIALG
jgi:hypothetical protein